MLKEFRDFLFRGNIIELAVAFVMGLAFAAVVNSLVNNLVMPVIAMIIGKPDFSDLTFTINDAVFRYGAFITDVIQFVAIAAAVFFFYHTPPTALLNRVRREPRVVGLPDEPRRHQELVPARGRTSRSPHPPGPTGLMRATPVGCLAPDAARGDTSKGRNAAVLTERRPVAVRKCVSPMDSPGRVVEPRHWAKPSPDSRQ